MRDAKGDVVDLGRQIGLSVPTVKKMLLEIDNGNLEQVEQQLNIMARNRTMQLSIVAKGGALPSTGFGGVTPSAVLPPGPAPAPTVGVVNMALPAGWRGDPIAAVHETARRSGGLYRRAAR